jgi:hypothetical protein
MVIHQLIFVATMTKVELSLIINLYKQISALENENLLLDNKVWQLEDNVDELEPANRLLKTQRPRNLRRTLDN